MTWKQKPNSMYLNSFPAKSQKQPTRFRYRVPGYTAFAKTENIRKLSGSQQTAVFGLKLI